MPYHLGHDVALVLDGHPIRVTLLSNPSHLEAVDPLVLGRARAAQDAIGPDGAAQVLPILLHTDAAVVGQGVVAECIQLAGPRGYTVGRHRAYRRQQPDRLHDGPAGGPDLPLLHRPVEGGGQRDPACER